MCMYIMNTRREGGEGEDVVKLKEHVIFNLQMKPHDNGVQAVHEVQHVMFERIVCISSEQTSCGFCCELWVQVHTRHLKFDVLPHSRNLSLIYLYTCKCSDTEAGSR